MNDKEFDKKAYEFVNRRVKPFLKKSTWTTRSLGWILRMCYLQGMYDASQVMELKERKQID